MLQWLGFSAFTAVAQVQFLVGEQRSYKPCSVARKKDKFFLPFSLRQFSVFSVSQRWDVINGFGPFLWSLCSLITGCVDIFARFWETSPNCCVSSPWEVATSLLFHLPSLITDFLGSECKSLKQEPMRFKKPNIIYYSIFIPTKVPAPWLPWQSKGVCSLLLQWTTLNVKLVPRLRFESPVQVCPQESTSWKKKKNQQVEKSAAVTRAAWHLGKNLGENPWILSASLSLFIYSYNKHLLSAKYIAGYSWKEYKNQEWLLHSYKIWKEKDPESHSVQRTLVFGQ